MDYNKLEDKQKYFDDAVSFAEEVLNMELFDYEKNTLRKYDERLNTKWYWERIRPTNPQHDYLRGIYQEWNKLRNAVDGGNRPTELRADMALLMREPRTVLDALGE